MNSQIDESHPHGGGRVATAGAPLASATGAIIALHGRGGDAEDIIALARHVAPPGVAIMAPQAAANTWYPYPFLEPFARNEPFLSSALRRVGELIAELHDGGLPIERIALLGFSQGACLALETVARLPRRYAAAIGFSGGLIGPPGTTFAYDGSLKGTSVFLGCSDVDPHIPRARVEESAAALRALGADVDIRIYPGMGHSINEDELAAARAILAPR